MSKTFNRLVDDIDVCIQQLNELKKKESHKNTYHEVNTQAIRRTRMFINQTLKKNELYKN